MPLGFNVFRSVPSKLKLNGPLLSITQQPQDVNTNANGVAVVTLTALAEFPNAKGVPSGFYIFKWYVDGVLVSDETPLYDDTQLVNEATLTMSALNSENKRFYEVYCDVEYFVGTSEGAALNSPLRSNTITVTVLPQLSITEQPSPITVAQNVDAEFYITASLPSYVTRPNIRYQWRLNGNDLNDGVFNDVISSTLNKVYEPDDTTVDRGKWKVIQNIYDEEGGQNLFEIDWSKQVSFDAFAYKSVYIIQPTKDIRMKISMVGGSGGGFNSGYSGSYESFNEYFPGSNGGAVIGEFTFLSSKKYTLIVGENGADNFYAQRGQSAPLDENQGYILPNGYYWAGGFPGGGGADLTQLTKGIPGGSGGGGMTVIFEGDSPPINQVNFDFGPYQDRVIMVAAGGGGTGESYVNGGKGGTPNGSKGTGPDPGWTIDLGGGGATQTAGGAGGWYAASAGSALKGGDAYANRYYNGSFAGGGGGAGYFGGGGGGATTYVTSGLSLRYYEGSGGGGSSYASGQVSNVKYEYPSNITPQPGALGYLLLEVIDPVDDVEPNSITVSGASTNNLTLTSTGSQSFGGLIDCRVTSSEAINSPVFSNSVQYQVLQPTNKFRIQAFNNSTGALLESEVSLPNLDILTVDSTSFGSAYDIIQFTPTEKDVTTQLKLVASAGRGYTRDGQNFPGGRGGMSILDYTFKQNVEYTIIGVSNNSAVFFYEKSNLIAVVGQGGDAGKGGRGGDGGGVNVDGTAGVGVGNNTAGGDRPKAGSLNNNGVYGSTMAGANIDLYPQDSIASGSDGGRTVSCSKGNYWIERGYSPCSDITNKKIKFVTSNGQEVSDSMSILRGFKSGYTVTETAGKGASKSGNGGNGATGGDGGVSGAGGGGGSGYSEGGLTIRETRSGGNTARSSYFEIGDELPRLPTQPTPPSGLITVSFTVTNHRTNSNSSIIFQKISGNGPDTITFSNKVSPYGEQYPYGKRSGGIVATPTFNVYQGSRYKATSNYYWFLGTSVGQKLERSSRLGNYTSGSKQTGYVWYDLQNSNMIFTQAKSNLTSSVSEIFLEFL